jgi:hypothetical protein
MNILKKLRYIAVGGLAVWLLVLVALVRIFGERQFISVIAIAGWVFLAICAVLYMYHFVFRKD